ncbi:MAG: alpha/beta hydrolase [Deltaproteobacteria bacterium]|nr:alpha/beta hydrolase [Deltaproteobacteria bacterium]
MSNPLAVILHGACDREEYFSERYPSLSNSHWLPWLQKQLLMAGYDAQSPEMPEAYLPDYAKWAHVFERMAPDLSESSILIGHSCGGGFFLRWLSEHQLRINKLVLVAPWIDPDKRRAQGTFFDFSPDPSLTQRMRVELLASTNDAADVQESVNIIRAKIPNIRYHEFKDYGHFCFSDMNTEVFPELREIVLAKL